MSERALTNPTDRPPDESVSSQPGATAGPAFVCLLLALITLAVFWPVKNCDFVNYDDPDYVTSNPHVQQGLTPASVIWAFGTGRASNWHPLAWLSHMLDVDLFGLDASGPHIVNLLFHVANTLLLFMVLRRLSGAHWRSAFVAALFALHPLHVESVAWISERKDVMSAFFWLLTIWAYARYVERAEGQRRTTDEHGWTRISGKTSTEGNEGNKGLVRELRESGEQGKSSLSSFASVNSGFKAGSKGWYGLALLFFVLGLMSKPMLVTLPFVLLLLDYWPLKRVPSSKFQVPSSEGQAPGTALGQSRPSGIVYPPSTLVWLIWEKIPFFVFSAISCVITFLVQRRAGAVGSLGNYPIGSRVENAFVSYARYLGKMFWPAQLAVPYPHPGYWPWAWVIFSVALVAGLSIGALWVGRKLPFVVTGWFWFLGTLIPVIGLVQVGTQSMADRYTYVPLIGAFIVLAWGAGAVVARWRLPLIAVVFAAVVVSGACAARTIDQLHYWQNSESLFRRAIELTRDNWLAYDDLGVYLYSKGHVGEAVENYHQALRIKPNDFLAYDNLGLYLYDKSRVDEAIENYRKSLQINPDNEKALNNLGNALASRKQYAEAIKCFEEALRLKPDCVEAHNNFGAVLDKVGRSDEAVRQYNEALRLDPDFAQAHNNLANILMVQGKADAAINHYLQAIQIKPDFVDALFNLAEVLAARGQDADAIDCYTRILQLNPDDATTRNNLGNILAKVGRSEEAVEQYTAVLHREPNYAEAHFGLGQVLAKLGRRDEAVTHLTEALRLKPDYAEAKCLLQSLEAPQPK
jgi:tetratricopeptide (TPR) repeat protein